MFDLTRLTPNGKSVAENLGFSVLWACAAAVVLGLAAATLPAPTGLWFVYRENSRVAERERVAQAVEAFRVRHGRYPVELNETKVVPDSTVYSSWGYWVTEDGQHCELSAYEDWFLGQPSWLYDAHRKTWTYHLDG